MMPFIHYNDVIVGFGMQKMQAPDDSKSRLDQLERIVTSLANTSGNLLNAAERHDDRISRLEDILLGQQALIGLITEQNTKLKRAVDYLLSKDGESNRT